MARVLLGLCWLLGWQAAMAAGPSEVAKADFGLWPRAIESRAEFDAASRAELLASAIVLDGLLKSALQASDLGIKQIQADSLAKWKDKAKAVWLRSYADASRDCAKADLGCGFQGTSWEAFIAFARRQEKEHLAKPPYSAWLANSHGFYPVYLKEQLRLAALFPRPSSEILALDDAEILGDEFKDRHFLLSLDDGPSPAGGYTDRYAELLSRNGVSAFFFALGNALEQRLKKTSDANLHKLYQNQCLGSHGYEHKPHPNWPEWRTSLEKTQALISRINPDQAAIMFRPPYGQRHAELDQYIANQHGKVVLWNIDSQDWNVKIAASEVADRVKKLMLLKRRGIVLFHDIHDKGLTAIPDILEFSQKSMLAWEDCRQIQ